MEGFTDGIACARTASRAPTLNAHRLRHLRSRYIFLLLVAVVVPVIVASAQGVEVWLTVVEPTEVYSDSDQLLWEAQPGESYRVLAIDDGWVRAYYEGDAPENAVWIALDGRVGITTAEAAVPSVETQPPPPVAQPPATFTPAPPTFTPTPAPTPRPLTVEELRRVVESVPIQRGLRLGDSATNVRVSPTSIIPVTIHFDVTNGSEWSDTYSLEQRVHFGRDVLAAIRAAYPTLTPGPAHSRAYLIVDFWDIRRGRTRPTTWSFEARQRYCELDRNLDWVCIYPALAVQLVIPDERYEWTLPWAEDAETWVPVR